MSCHGKWSIRALIFDIHIATLTFRAFMRVRNVSFFLSPPSHQNMTTMTRKGINLIEHLKAVAAAAVGIVAVSFTSCDNAIYDYEGDCEPHFRVKFLYDYNMKFADAFPHEVNSVTLRLLDADGKVVWMRTDSGEALSLPGYCMDVDCPPGTYSLHVWAEGRDGMPFRLAPSDAGTFDMLSAHLPGIDAVGGIVDSDDRLSDLYHGYETSVTFPADEGTYTHTVPLTKDTNYVRVVLQQTSSEQLGVEDLDISITDNNGRLNPDNSPRPDGSITYRPWALTPLKADIEDKGLCDGVLAEFSLSRLMADHGETARLTVRDKDKTIFSIRLIDFLLMVKGNYNRAMGDQEYLDRQDVWDLTFFLEEGKLWLATYIYINSWRVVLQTEDLGN